MTSLTVRFVVQFVFGLAAIDALLFRLAGRVDWPAPWVMTVLFVVAFSIGAPWMVRHDPNLLQERLGGVAPNVPQWDRWLVRAFRLLLVALIVTAGIDAGRLRWSRMPPGVQAIGALAVVAAIGGIWWCVAVNHFLARYARIQTDRGHTVIRDGPYRYVRHPMYLSIIVLVVGVALLLGSWLALVPAALIAAVFVIRTTREDFMLRMGLDGYRQYAEQVPSRLLPGVW